MVFAQRSSDLSLWERSGELISEGYPFSRGVSADTADLGKAKRKKRAAKG